MVRPVGQRSNDSYLASYELRLLYGICSYIPESVTPDHLTLLGLVGAFIAFFGYFGTRFDSRFFWVASVGLGIQWLGDSLDGSLARYRRQERPRYGYFLDCMTDAFCCLLIGLGLGLSPYVRMDAALFALAGYYMLCIYVFLNHHLNGVHKISFMRWGPTETRLSLVALNMVMFFGGPSLMKIFGKRVSIYDVFITLDGALSIMAFVWLMMRGVEALDAEDQPAKPENAELDVPLLAKSGYRD